VDNNYKAAYERQKLAREKAENQLENISRELYDSNNALKEAYITLKNQKSQLLHQEKLASIGQLSAGIAHEINNPAGFIKSNLASLQNYSVDVINLIKAYQKLVKIIDYAEDIADALSIIAEKEAECDIEYLMDDIPNLIKESIDGANRITKIVNGLKTFSRVDSDTKEPVDVNECIQNTIKLVNNEIKYKAKLLVDLTNIPVIMGYPGGLSQVILNLLVNASQAIAGFGEISITTRVEKKEIIIRVKDNGVGIAKDKIDKIFDPFFTTKGVGLGTGLGLSISAGIIEQHHGRMSVESEEGSGACFTIVLPVIDLP
jgi:signal transduction histidine kinase